MRDLPRGREVAEGDQAKGPAHTRQRDGHPARRCFSGKEQGQEASPQQRLRPGVGTEVDPQPEVGVGAAPGHEEDAQPERRGDEEAEDDREGVP